MSEIYGESYFKNYDVGAGTVDYLEAKETKGFLQYVARRIVDNIHPKTVLDAGCAMGHLVAALRDLGVEAYGVDISEYAISKAREDIRPYCAVGSLTDPIPDTFPQQYDLIVTIEVLEHLCEEDGKKAIRNLCKHTDRVIFASTPDNYEDPTHINVQKRDYWARLFAEEGFFDDLSDRPLFLKPYAVNYVRRSEWLTQLESYEQYIESAERVDTKALMRDVKKLEAELAKVKSSKSWRIMEPVRKVNKKLHSNLHTQLALKGIKSLTKNGFRVTWIKAKNKLRYLGEYKKASTRQLYTEEELKAQRKETFSKEIKISILVPLYNTPEKFLREMIQSVLDQTYANWELCLADGSDTEHQNVERICCEYVQKDQRIRYQKLEENLGISGNTNACIEMSTGEYIALFDHDDILHPAALHDVMKEICEKGAEYIYTDEATFESPNLKKIITIHCKPDYALDNLRANNYICHLSVFRKDLLEKAGGGFRGEYDGSQDHDLILRLTAAAECVAHIPKVLYYWRSHPQSVAQDISAKTYAIDAGRNAVRDSAARSGYQATVECSRAAATIYRVRYELKENPKVSIIIPSKDHVEDLKRCVNSIFAKTTYRNYELIILDNGSLEKETWAYYEKLKSNSRVVLCSLDIPFNFSKLNNYAVEKASGQYYLFLNNDTEIITTEWIEEMLMYVQREDVAAAGAMLYYPDDTIQHAGIILGMGSDRVAGHPFYRCDRLNQGYMGRLCYAQNMSAVTAACMLVKASVFREVGGFDETFAVAYNDVDLCMRIRKAGHLIVWTPYAELYHYESKTRGQEDTGEKMQRFQREVKLFRTRWEEELEKGDPYYNPNFRLDRSDFTLW